MFYFKLCQRVLVHRHVPPVCAPCTRRCNAAGRRGKEGSLQPGTQTGEPCAPETKQQQRGEPDLRRGGASSPVTPRITHTHRRGHTRPVSR